jgi:hypothetical protein
MMPTGVSGASAGAPFADRHWGFQPKEESALTDKTSRIGEIVEIMLDTWDLPADCNEGELFTYAETLYDRIIAGDSKDKLYAYLSEVQVDHLEMAKTEAFRTIVDRAVDRASRPS